MYFKNELISTSRYNSLKLNLLSFKMKTVFLFSLWKGTYVQAKMFNSLQEKFFWEQKHLILWLWNFGKLFLRCVLQTCQWQCSTHNTKCFQLMWSAFTYTNTCFLLFLETGSLYIAHSGLQLTIFLPPPPLRCWDYKHAPSHPTLIKLYKKLFCFYFPQNYSLFILWFSKHSL
jgi:hypothetical protein